jgi:hypothetical protein
VIEAIAVRPLLPPGDPAHVGPLHGLLWLQQGFRLFTAQPGRWVVVLGLWLLISLVLPVTLAIALEDLRQLAVIALAPLGLDDTLGKLLMVLPMLAPLAIVLLFPLVFAGLMVGCAAVAQGERLHPRHLLAAFAREPARLVTVGGINAVGQILISEAIAWFVQDRLGDVNFDLPQGASAAQKLAQLLGALSQATPLILPVVILQTLLMAALWFTPPLLVFHDMTPLAAIRASLLGCARNAGSLAVYGLAVVLMLSLVGAVSLSAGSGVVFAVIALGVLTAAMTTVIASLYISYRDIFRPQN